MEDIEAKIADVISRLDRIEKALGQLIPRPHDTGTPVSLSTANATLLTGVSQSHVRRAVKRGELPASNVGTAHRPLWRITLHDLAVWYGRKKGGATAVPARSERNDLIRLHAPDRK